MAETDWLRILGGVAGQAAGAYAGSYVGNPQAGAQFGGAMGESLGAATSQETGLTEGAGYDPNAMYGTYSQSMGGGGGMGGMMDMFGGGGGGGGGMGGGGMGGGGMYRAPTMSTGQLFGLAGNYLPQIAGYENAYDLARQPGYTQSLLNAEQQAAPGTFDLRQLAIQQENDALAREWRLPPGLQQLLADRSAETLGLSGAGASNLGQMFDLRSIAGAGLDYSDRNRANAFARSQFNPNYYQPGTPFGNTQALTFMGDIRGEEAFQNSLNILNTQTQLAAQQKAQQSQANTNAFNNKLRESGEYVGGAGGGAGGTGRRGSGAWDAYNKGVGTPPINPEGGNPANRNPDGSFDWTSVFRRTS